MKHKTGEQKAECFISSLAMNPNVIVTLTSHWRYACLFISFVNLEYIYI